MRMHLIVWITYLKLIISSPSLKAQLRDLASLSDAETTASILTRLLLQMTSGRPVEARVFIPEVSDQALDMIIREISEAMDTRNALPRYEQIALCDIWNSSDKSDDAVLEALDAYDSARLAAGNTYAGPFVLAEANIEATLTNEDLRNFQDFMNRWRTTYSNSQGMSGSFFSTAIRKNPSIGKESIELQCGP